MGRRLNFLNDREGLCQALRHLFSIFVLGVFYLASNTATTVTATLPYAAGLSMITLLFNMKIVSR